jgi:electron transport complex protein RnfC
MPTDDIGIDKTSNCILALSQENTQLHGDSLPCIRCGECVNVCPAELLPQQLHWYINGGNLEKAREHHVFDCIECGACAWVCPSQIKLVDYYRFAKSELTYLDFKRKKSDEAQLRHEQREQRLLRMKQERMAKRKRTTRRTQNPEKVKLDLQATLDRVKNQVKAKDSEKDDNHD